MLGGGGEQCLTVMELFWDRVARDTPMPGGDGAQHMPRVALWGTGCVHCKHGQGQTLLHFARAFPLGGPRTFALLQAEIVVSPCCSGATLRTTLWSGVCGDVQARLGCCCHVPMEGSRWSGPTS